MFLQLFTSAVIVLHFNIPPGVDIDLFDPGSEDILGEEGKLCHFCVKLIDQLFLRFSCHRDAIITNILCNIPFDLLLYFLISTLCHKRGIFAGDILLYFF